MRPPNAITVHFCTDCGAWSNSRFTLPSHCAAKSGKVEHGHNVESTVYQLPMKRRTSKSIPGPLPRAV